MNTEKLRQKLLLAKKKAEKRSKEYSRNSQMAYMEAQRIDSQLAKLQRQEDHARLSKYVGKCYVSKTTCQIMYRCDKVTKKGLIGMHIKYGQYGTSSQAIIKDGLIRESWLHPHGEISLEQFNRNIESLKKRMI